MALRQYSVVVRVTQMSQNNFIIIIYRTSFLILLFSLHLRNVKVPCFFVTRQKKCSSQKYTMFSLFPVRVSLPSTDNLSRTMLFYFIAYHRHHRIYFLNRNLTSASFNNTSMTIGLRKNMQTFAKNVWWCHWRVRIS